MTIQELSQNLARAEVRDSNHHLWRNGRFWWIAFTVHTPDWRVHPGRRTRVGLNSSSIEGRDTGRQESDPRDPWVGPEASPGDSAGTTTSLIVTTGAHAFQRPLHACPEVRTGAALPDRRYP